MTIPVMGVHVDALSVDELHDRILQSCREGPRSLIFNVNAHALNLAWEDSHFRALLNEADTCFCDGFGVRIAALMAGYHLPPRITYADWTWEFARFSSQHDLSWFLLGGVPGRAEEAAASLLERVPGLDVAGTHHGFFDKDLHSAENQNVCRRINASGANVLLVGFGMPIQERWLAENWPGLDAGVGLPGGAFLDYVSGAVRRAPPVFTRTGFEWLGRLVLEPRRLWRRYIIGNPRFLLRATRAAWNERRRVASGRQDTGG